MTDADKEVPVEAAPDKPKFRKKETRVRVALAKYYGMGDDGEGWDIERIADYLRVSVDTVRDYVYRTDLSDQVEEKLADAQAKTRMEIAMRLLDRLDMLEEMIQEKRQVKQPEVVSHKIETVEGDVTMKRDGMSVGGENTKEMEFDVPVPDQFAEVTKVDNEMETLLREWRQTVDEIEDLLGLEAPDQIESEHREVKIEGKVIKNVDSSGFPSAEPEDEEEELSRPEIVFEGEDDGGD